MKRKILVLVLCVISALCCAVCLSACGGDKGGSGNNSGGNGGTTEHTHNLAATSAKGATCTEAGNIAYWFCSGCSKYFSDANGTQEVTLESTVVAALGHDYAADYTVDTPASCGVTGSKSKHCSRCDSTTDVTEIAALEHSYGEWEIVTAATCTSSGERVRTCSACENVDNDFIEPFGHDFPEEYTVDRPATCSQEGSKSKHCSRCKSSIDITAIATVEHSYGEWETVTPATCINNGLKKKTCPVCTAFETEQIDALGHDYAEEYTIDIPANCTEVGSKSRHCSRCNAATEATRIDATGHSYGEWEIVTAATCTSSGERMRTCSACENVDNDFIEPLGHDYAEEYTIDDPSTCVIYGGKSKHCSRCDSTTDFQQIPLAPHTPTVSYEQKATCTEDGWTDYECSVCGSPLFDEHQDFPATGHNYVDGVCENCGRLEAEEYFIFTLSVDEQYYIVSDSNYVKDDTITSLAVPAEFKGLPVTEIGAHALGSLGQLILDEIVLPDSITTIGDHALQGLNIKTLTIPKGVTSFGVSIYNNSINPRFEKLIYNAVNGDDRDMTAESPFNFLKEYTLVIGSDVEHIPAYMFARNNYNKAQINEIIFAENSKCKTIGTGAFEMNITFTELQLPDSLVTIGNYAFASCEALEEVTFGSGLKEIGDGAFAGVGLTEVVIPNNVTKIGYGTFNFCTSLTDLTLPFVGGSASTTASKETLFAYIFGGSGGQISFVQEYAENELENFWYCSQVKNVTITGGNILYGAFSYCSFIENLTLPANITSIGEYALYECHGLTSIVIPESVKTIGANAFDACRGLLSIVIPEGVTSIGENAFFGCYRLVEVYNLSALDVTVSGSAGEYALNVYTELSDRNCFTITDDGLIFYDDTEHNNGYYLLGSITNPKELVLPDSFKGNGYKINKYAFCCIHNKIYIMDPIQLESITLGSGVKSIGAYAFAYSILEKVNFGSGVKSIGDHAFDHCQYIENLVLPNSVESIGKSAFYMCDKIESVTMGTGLRTVGSSAFYMCSSINKLYISDLAAWCAVDFEPYNSQPLEGGAGGDLYVNNTLVTSLVIPNSVTVIKEAAFSHCTSITEVRIGSNVTELGDRCFWYCPITDIHYAGTEEEWGAITKNFPGYGSTVTMHYGA